MSFTVVTYNVLADAYVRPSYYPHTEPELFPRRWPLLLARLRELAPDVLCLQELEASRALRLDGYHGHYARKGERKPDGCGTFTRARPLRAERLEYSDGTGHVALLVVVELDGGRLGVANTHLRWDRDNALGLAQLTELLDFTEELECDGWIVCGDFNADPRSPSLLMARDRGWLDPGGGPTCNANARAKRIDFLLHTPSLRADPHPLRAIDDHTPLPSEEEPSDHLALGATFAWA